MNILLPKPTAALVDAGGRPTREGYDFLRSLASAVQVDANVEEIRALVAQIQGIDLSSFLHDTAQVRGLASVSATGSLAAGLVALQLVNDADNPAPASYYGTDAAGAKGFHALPSGGGSVPYFVPAGQTFSVAEFQQALFSMPIEVEGSLEVDGYLIEVD